MIRHFLHSRDAITLCVGNPDFAIKLVEITELLISSFGAGNKLLLCGNGGSAGDVQHIAAEFVGKYRFDRPPLAAIALTTDTSILTAVGNDYGFDRVFARQVAAIGQKDDVLFAFSTSGRSSNVCRAVEQARVDGLISVGFTGAHHDETLTGLCDHFIKVPATSTPIIQQLHLMIGHAICEEVEQRVFQL